MFGLNSRFNIKENVTYELRDKDGNIKPLFQENDLYIKLLKLGLASPYHPIVGLYGYFAPQKQVSNLVTTVGKALVAGRINDSGTPAAATYIAVGTGTTAANIADTTLETEISDSGLARAAATVSLVTTDTTNDTARLVKSFSVSGTKAVTEAGALNASSNGTLLARQVFSAINVVSGDTLSITWNFDVD
jgi:hypothetical protein